MKRPNIHPNSLLLNVDKKEKTIYLADESVAIHDLAGWFMEKGVLTLQS